MEHLRRVFDLSERRACEILEQPRSTQRYHPKQLPADEARRLALLRAVLVEHPRYGYRRISEVLQRLGEPMGPKAVYLLRKRVGIG